MTPYQEFLIWLYSANIALAILIVSALLWHRIIRLAQVIFRELKTIIQEDSLHD